MPRPHALLPLGPLRDSSAPRRRRGRACGEGCGHAERREGPCPWAHQQEAVLGRGLCAELAPVLPPAQAARVLPRAVAAPSSPATQRAPWRRRSHGSPTAPRVPEGTARAAPPEEPRGWVVTSQLSSSTPWGRSHPAPRQLLVVSVVTAAPGPRAPAGTWRPQPCAPCPCACLQQLPASAPCGTRSRPVHPHVVLARGAGTPARRVAGPW